MNKILMCCYNSICEQGIIQGFRDLNYQVDEFHEAIEDIDYDTDYLTKLAGRLTNESYTFVFSINFFPVISRLCNLLKLPYISWLVDSPVHSLYSDTLRNPNNHIFSFDYALYNHFVHRNPSCIHHLPLAADIHRWDAQCQSITANDRRKFTHDICFIGSLYTEKCPYYKFDLDKNPYLKGYLEGIMQAQTKISGYNLLPEVLSCEVIEMLKNALPWTPFPEDYHVDENYFFADEFIGMKLSSDERIMILNQLAEHYSVSLYTQSDTSVLRNVDVRGTANSSTEMPKIFHLSKINLNPVIKPIKSGIPKRAWDILGCGGFLMSSYQPELENYFELGTDLETYDSTEELIDKCGYYLSHEEERSRIAQNGYRKAKHNTIQLRLQQMLDTVTQ